MVDNFLVKYGSTAVGWIGNMFDGPNSSHYSYAYLSYLVASFTMFDRLSQMQLYDRVGDRMFDALRNFQILVTLLRVYSSYVCVIKYVSANGLCYLYRAEIIWCGHRTIGHDPKAGCLCRPVCGCLLLTVRWATSCHK